MIAVRNLRFRVIGGLTAVLLSGCAGQAPRIGQMFDRRIGFHYSGSWADSIGSRGTSDRYLPERTGEFGWNGDVSLVLGGERENRTQFALEAGTTGLDIMLGQNAPNWGCMGWFNPLALSTGAAISIHTRPWHGWRLGTYSYFSANLDRDLDWYYVDDTTRSPSAPASIVDLRAREKGVGVDREIGQGVFLHIPPIFSIEGRMGRDFQSKQLRPQVSVTVIWD